MASETTPNAPREAYEFRARDGYQALAVDNESGGGLVARVRAAVHRTMPNAFEGAWIVADQIADEVLRECGVQP